jgi:Styrene monooxygenase A putative substrate binding domain
MNSGKRVITIVGGGQSGLQLGNGLVSAGYDVRLVQDRKGDDIRTGKVMSSQCMFDKALSYERELGLNFWDKECPTVDSLGVAIAAPDGSRKKILEFNGLLDKPAQAVDQRVKYPRWMQEFEKHGGAIEYKQATPADFEKYAAESDLVIVAAGKGDIARMFERDAQKSQYDAPQRALALTYVKGLTPRQPHSGVNFNIAPGVGEYFVFPSLTTTGPCEIMVFEGIPGGPMDCWDGISSPVEHLAKSKGILETYWPWEAERAKNVELTDANGILAGRITPTVRKPTARLPSGKAVLGMADVVVLNDPITGQGSNNASKCAKIYLDAILAQGHKPYDQAWMQATFDRYWDYAQYVTGWTNALMQPPPPHVLNIFGAAQTSPVVAGRFANCFNEPLDLFPWFAVPEEADKYLKSLAA